MDTIESITYKDYTINIYPDFDPINPIKEFDMLGSFLCFHRRYDLGNSNGFSNPQDFQEWVKEQKGKVVILPLYLYDHGNLTISTGPFSCPWDSGQVGWIYITHDKIRKEYQRERITKKLLDTVVQALKSEVALYDNYLTGSVYGYQVAPLYDDQEIIDSCWGFYGYDHNKSGLLDTARDSIENDIRICEEF